MRNKHVYSFNESLVIALGEIMTEHRLFYNFIIECDLLTPEVLEVGGKQYMGGATINPKTLRPTIVLPKTTYKYGHKFMKYVLVHEALHLWFNHTRLNVTASTPWRRRVNAAQDYVINHIVYGSADNYEKIEGATKQIKEGADKIIAKYEGTLSQEEINEKISEFAEPFYQENPQLLGLSFGQIREVLEENGYWQGSWTNTMPILDTLDHMTVYSMLFKRQDDNDYEVNWVLESNDGHAFGDEQLQQADLDVASQNIQNIIAQSKADCERRQNGYSQNGNGALSLLVNRLFKVKTDCRSIIQNFAKRARDVKKRSSWKRQHRRYPGQCAGTIVDRHPKILNVIDVSGSNYDESTMRNISSHIQALYTVSPQLVIVAGDTAETCRWDLTKKNGGKFDARKLEWKGGGGTDLQFGHDLAKELGVDGVVVHTDGEFYDLETFGIPTLFMIYPGGQKFKPEKYKNVMIDKE